MLQSAGRSLALVVCGVLLTACGDGPPTPLSADPTAPTLDRDTRVAPSSPAPPEGPYCKRGKSGKYASTVRGVIDQQGKNGENFWALGGGCIKRPLREIWAATHGEGIGSWRESDIKSFDPVTDARVEFAFRSRHEAGPTLPFVGRTSWTMDWFQTLTQGDASHPLYLVVKYAKSKGTAHIQFWEGSFELKWLDGSTTSFVMRNEVRGTQIDAKKAAGAVKDLYQRLQTLPPVWTYLKK